MANETLVAAVKAIVAAGRNGTPDDAYAGYLELFSGDAFPTYAPNDQRQTLKMMILMKGAPRQPTPAMVEAHRAALRPLTDLVTAHAEPADHETLGICHKVVGDPEAADRVFRAGLALERARNPSSDLCGRLMKLVAS